MRGLGSGRRGDLVSASRRNDLSFEGEFEAESNETEKFAIARRARQTRETRVLPRLPESVCDFAQLFDQCRAFFPIVDDESIVFAQR
jgi:hypothetical protein